MSDFVLWGTTASPYQLKMQSMLDYGGHSWRRAPEQLSLSKAMCVSARLEWAKARGNVLRFGGMKKGLDEYPTVPFYSLDGKVFYYDSTRLAWHLDGFADRREHTLLPEQPALRFVAQLIDEAIDEFGLYMVHHNRWVISAATNNMGSFTARELRAPAFLVPRVARWLARRQSQRCPYLFSVAPKGFEAGVDKAITPPTRHGFPPTHDLLNQAWYRYLAALEKILTAQPFILGERFTLADASIYGQFSMNLVDGQANELMKERAPRTHAWLCHIRDGGHQGGRGVVASSTLLADLLSVIGDTFVPLMKQNDAAWKQAVAAGETLFNETAFHQGRALYDGELMGYPFRHVVKTFQVSVWQDLLSAWQTLGPSEQQQVLELLPSNMFDAFSDDGAQVA
ncbi:MAG: glutathione S-transferase domain-containing protein [Gammaproteobacteria bacterium]